MANIKEKTEALNKALEAISEEEMQEVAGGLSKGGKIALATAGSIIGVGAAVAVGLGAAGSKGKGPLKGLLGKKTEKTDEKRSIMTPPVRGMDADLYNKNQGDKFLYGGKEHIVEEVADRD